MFANFNTIIIQKDELEKKLSESSWSNNDESIEITRKYQKLNKLVLLKQEYDNKVKELADNQTLLLESEDDPDMQRLIDDDIKVLEESISILEKKIKLKLLPPDKNDGRAVIVEIRAGTGGEEASLFTSDLFKMYQKYAESLSLTTEILSLSSASKGGLKEVVFSLKGDVAWSQFKYESGTHRVQRVPITESSGRIHTSAVTVAIMAEPEDVDIHINEKDLRIDTYRSSGPGGQSVNTMDSAIRITHLPSGLVVTCQDEKSQLKNKIKAMRILRARLLDKIQMEENQKRSENRKQQIGSGDRSEKIRTYNFPQSRITDHRINLNLYNLLEVLAGNMDLLTLALAEAEYKKIVSPDIS